MIWLVGLGLAFGGFTWWALSDDDEPSSPVARDQRIAALLRDWMAVANGAAQSWDTNDRDGFLGQVGLLYKILADVCAVSPLPPDIHCDAQGEAVSQTEFASLYQAALFAPETMTVPRLLQTATGLVSLGYMYEAKLMLDVAVRDV